MSAVPGTEPTVLRDVVYGSGRVACSTDRPRIRPLALDVYLPPASFQGGRPGLMMAFGGAFHRGSKEDDSFEAEAGNTAVAEYCLRFAREGYVCFSIDYRLVQEDPDAGTTQVVQVPESIPTSRVDVVRKLLGLAPAKPVELWRGIEAAADDMAAAVRFVRSRAGDWGLDPGRLAIGGFSAGARTAMNVAFGERVPVAGVVSLSGYIDSNDLARHLSALDAPPPVLLVHAEHDLDYVARETPSVAATLRAAGSACAEVRVAGAGHFYRAEALGHGPEGPASVQQAMRQFLEKHL